MDTQPNHFNFNRFFARYLCGGEALKAYRMVSRAQLALTRCDVGYFEPNAVDLSLTIDRFMQSLQLLSEPRLQSGSRLNKTRLCQVNQILRKTEEKGYRNTEVWIGEMGKKAKRIPPPALSIENLMKEWLATANQKKQTLKEIFNTYIEFLWIHPFLDGNGRTGRVILMFLLERGGFSNLPLDLYRLKNKKQGHFESQIEDYSTTKHQVADSLFFENWQSWEGPYQSIMVKKIKESTHTIENQLLFTSLNKTKRKCLRLLWEQPIVSIKTITKTLKIDQHEAIQALNFFNQHGILEKKRSKQSLTPQYSSLQSF